MVLLIPLGKKKTITTIFEPNLKEAFLNTRTMDTGQVHNWDSQSRTLNYIRQRFIKTDPSKLCTSHVQPTRGKQASWCNSCLHTSPYMWSSTFCEIGATMFIYRSEITWLVILNEQHSAFQEMIWPWASGAYRIETALSYRSLYQSNLVLKYNFSHHNIYMKNK